jgi:LacI family transcriptional regulator, repressor for deo operon, udp, cdd, tsx, nupC, and nupG
MAVSADDVATAAGVSTATVSRAMRGLPRVSPKTREKILAIAEELGYVASSSASGLATGRTRTVGVLAPYVNRWFFSAALDGVCQELHGRGYNLSLFNLGGGHSRNRDRAFKRTMVQKHIDALLVLCTLLTEEEIKHLHHVDMPLVVIGGPVTGCPSVAIDDCAAAEQATGHLISLGHKDVGLLNGDDDSVLKFAVPILRTQGFKNSMVRAEIPIRKEWDRSGNFTAVSGQRALVSLWEQPGPKPTAIFCASDEMAFGVIFEARRLGISVPGDLSVIGIDDHEFSEAVGLTTIRQSPSDQAQLGTKMLLDELAGHRGAVRTVVAPHELIVRDSTAPPQASRRSPAHA